MTVFNVILAVSPVLLLGAVVFLVLIVAGIRKRDRGDLNAPAKNRLDAITRRVTGLSVCEGEEGDR